MAKTLQDGINLLKEGDLEASEALFLKLLEKNPEDRHARLWLGECYVLSEDFSKAKETFRKLLLCGDETIQEEAVRQLRRFQFHRIMQFLVIHPPLRWLLLFSVVGYMVSWGLRATPWASSAMWVEIVFVWGGLALFFFWALFIVVFFVGEMAFSPDVTNKSAAKSAKIAFGLALLFVIPANLFVSYGLAVKVLAVFLDAFVLSLFLSRGLSLLQKKIVGSEELSFLKEE